MTWYTEITVVGDDKTGIIARVTTLLFERGSNIEDLDQAVRDGVFRMTLHVDTTEMTCTEGELRDGVDRDEYQLGLPPEMRELTPDRPVDGLGQALAEK